MEQLSNIALNDVHFDGSIYPRDKPSTTITEEYRLALAGGATFPPIILEEGTNRLLDGYHRWKAHIAYFEGYNPDDPDGPEPTNTISCIFHSIPENISPKLYCYSLSANNGYRPSSAEREKVAQEQFKAYPGTPAAVIARWTKTSEKTARKYIKPLLAEFEESKRSIIMRLDMLGWTQDEISSALVRLWPDADGITQRSISKFLEDSGKVLNLLRNDLAAGHTPETVAKRHGLPEIIVWNIALQDEDDLARMKALGITPQPYDVWNFSKCHDLFGNDWPGRIPGQLVAQVLKQFTKPGDCVIDPMAGSGTTLDVCLAFNRKCYAYDMNLESNRPDVIEHNILEDGWPERTKKADLIFWDPPYFDKKDKEYMDGGISSMGRDEYLKFFHDRFTEAYEIVKKGAQLVFLMSPWDDPDDESNIISVRDYANLMEKSGWSIRREIHCPLSTQQVHPDIVNKFNLSNRQTRLARAITRGVKV